METISDDLYFPEQFMAQQESKQYVYSLYKLKLLTFSPKIKQSKKPSKVKKEWYLDL